MAHSRRDMLKIAGTAGAALASVPAASKSASAGDLDLQGIPIVDSHLHPYKRALISAQYVGQRETLTDAVLPPGDYPDKETVRARLLKGDADLVWGVARRTGHFNYVARTYGVPPTLDGFDSVLKPHITSDSAFVDYVRVMLDRSNIATLVVQSAEPEPVVPRYLAPEGRTVWTWPVSQLAEPDWARQRGLTELTDVLAAVGKTHQAAVTNGCRGFKNL